VLGAGAIGGLWALRLATAGTAVTLLAHDENTPTRTLTLQDGERFSTHCFAQENVRAASTISHLLVATKANRTADALAPLLPQLQPHTLILLLQNGLGVDDWLCAQRPDIRVLTGITNEGVYRHERDYLIRAGAGETMLGSTLAEHENLAQQTAETFSHTGWPVQFIDNIKYRRWQKFAINCLINPLTARYRCRNGELLNNPEALATMRAISTELAQVMQAEGFNVHADALWTDALHVAEITGANTSSMLADVLAQRETEINFINGYLLQKALQHHIDVPVNTALVKEVQALAHMPPSR
jgi:2-dehydropantoate 2-reductase